MMQAANYLEGMKCWLCDRDVADFSTLAVDPNIATHIRGGALLGSTRRIFLGRNYEGGTTQKFVRHF